MDMLDGQNAVLRVPASLRDLFRRLFVFWLRLRCARPLVLFLWRMKATSFAYILGDRRTKEKRFSVCSAVQ
jgi:hypothetical protein